MKKIAAEGLYRRMPVSREILSDFITPIEVLRKMKRVSKHTYMLESAYAQEKWGRYTFLGYDPAMEITCTDGKMKVGALTIRTDDPGSYLRQILAEYRSPRIEGLPPFTGGLVGYFSYDFLKYAEPTLRRRDRLHRFCREPGHLYCDPHCLSQERKSIHPERRGDRGGFGSGERVHGMHQ